MATKRQVTLRFRDEYMKASKKDKGRILDEMCSVLAIGRSTARRRLAEAGRGPVSFQPCAAFHLLHAQFSFAIVGGLQPFGAVRVFAVHALVDDDQHFDLGMGSQVHDLGRMLVASRYAQYIRVRVDYTYDQQRVFAV